jgi:predicted metal-dependent hydrolase
MSIYLNSNQIREIADENEVSLRVANLYAEYVAKAKEKNMVLKMGRNTLRDSTRQKTYNAENKFMAIHGRGTTFNTVAEAQKFADKVFASKVWEKHKTNRVSSTSPRIEYSNKMTRYSGIAYSSRITLGRNGMNAYILLHELAHTNGHRHHDSTFRKCLVAFVAKFMGKEQGELLSKHFKDAGLKMTVPTVKTVKEFKDWHIMFKRMETARQIKNNY